MTSKKLQKRGASRKAASGKRPRSMAWDERAGAIVADAESYSDETRHAISNALTERATDLADLVTRAEAGEDILDARNPLVGEPGETEAEAFKRKAVAYAQTAYTAALAHYEAHHADPFTLSRLAVVYGEQRLGDFNIVVTLPGVMRDRAIGDEDLRGALVAAERIARTLEDPECSDAYRKAFGSIYTYHLLQISRVSWEHPTAVRVLIPLVMLDLWGNRPADADTALDILSMTLRDALLSDEVCERTRAING
jgi:hypothetical protein